MGKKMPLRVKYKSKIYFLLLRGRRKSGMIKKEAKEGGGPAGQGSRGVFMARRDKINYYLDIADTVSLRGTCLRRNYGAIIVKNDEIISTGYVGAPRGRKNCSDLGVCIREKMQVPRGERYELCRSVHAEANAIISAGRSAMIGGTLYLSGRNARTGEYVENAMCCSMCKRMVINAGISKVIVRVDDEHYRTVDVESEWVAQDESLSGEMGY